MVKLRCAIVRPLGQTKLGGVFEVEINDASSVDALKNAIAEKQKSTFPASDLELFLAKRQTKKEKEEEKEETNPKEGEWLTQREALDGVSDTSGYQRLQFPGAELRDVGLECGEVAEGSHAEKAAGMGRVHVLVVAPKVAEREATPFPVKEFKKAMSEVLDEREQRSCVYSISTSTASRQDELMRKLGYQYRTIDVREENDDSVGPYTWLENVAEDHAVQRKGCIQYLKANLRGVLHQDGSATRRRTSSRKKPTFHLADTSQLNNLLNVDTSSSLPFGVDGTADLMIIDNAAKAMNEVFAGLQFVIKLKNGHCGGNERSQILLQLAAADLKSENRCAPIGLLTNLSNYWYFLWFTPSRETARLTLTCPANGFKMMREMLSATSRTPKEVFPMRIQCCTSGRRCD